MANTKKKITNNKRDNRTAKNINRNTKMLENQDLSDVPFSLCYNLEVISLLGIARNTYYEYKRELKEGAGD